MQVKRWISVSLVLWVGLSGAASASPAEQPRFHDVSGHWAENTITRLVDDGILDGFPDGTFRPDEFVTADQFIKMLLMSYSQQYPNGERKWTNEFVQSLSALNQSILSQDYRTFNFKPSTTGYWAKPFIDIASDLQFISKSQFPDFKAKLKREQVAEIIYYTAKETEYLEDEEYSRKAAAGIGDLQSANPREQKFITEAFTKGIMEGYPNGYFGVGRDVTRAESLAILDRIVHKDKRIQTAGTSQPALEKVVPTRDGGYKKIIFPDTKMLQAYDVLQDAAKRRGTNYDLEETTLRLYEDAEAKSQDLSHAASDSHGEEAALWMEPQYKTYGVTVKVQDGMLARNQEAIQTFTNYLFAYDAMAFNELFMKIYNEVMLGQPVEDTTVQVGGYSVEIHAEDDLRTIVFSILEKKV